MYEYLRQHPEVFMPEVKEPYFFGCDLGIKPYWRIHDEAEYRALFNGAEAAKRIGEGSVWYIYSKTAAREIREFNSTAQIIALLRNPVDVLYSLHGQFLRSQNENIYSFEEALAAEPDRRRGRRIPGHAHFPAGLLYREVVSFSNQVQRYFDVFGRENVLPVVFDDMVADTPGVYRQVLEFLRLDATFQPTFEVFNESKFIRLRPSRRFWKEHYRLEPKFDRIFGHTIRGGINTVVDFCLGRSLDRARKMKPETRSRLQAELKPEIDALGRVLGRDLSHWYASS